MTKLYTKTGDDGSTGLVGGDRVRKDSLRIEAIGEIDELNAVFGLCRTYNRDTTLGTILHGLQEELFVLGADLSTPIDKKCPVKRISLKEIKGIEKNIDEYTENVASLKNFILPGGNDSAAHLHLARAVCRRAERTVVALQKKERIGEFVLPYLNRLSDLLFVFSRYENEKDSIFEEKWSGKKK